MSGAADPSPRYDFEALLAARCLALPPRSVGTLQLNLTKLCNQACRHCHVDASPARRERMSRETIDDCLEVLARYPEIRTLDLTGGAPELHPDFEYLVVAAAALGRQLMVRHNLTVQLDPHPLTGASLAHLPTFFARHRVEVVSSLPYHQAYFTDSQRGAGVFDKSLEALRRLNAQGYGQPGSGLVLNLVYNPVGPYLPAAQASLEADYRRELRERHGLQFNRLFTITNMPIHRFRLHLEKSGQYAAYMDKLLAAFNPAAAEGVMCRDLLSVDWNGAVYDCDFNQQLGLRAEMPLHIRELDLAAALRRRIRFGDHCLGCTAGAGSSCGGATT
ncbi:MAG TPA: arsenosugar biosynthesis radical SAM (seleno)protein ArsS [Solimonas sp.]|nr:arsenosugar biosynthesis radical SAM (seleno)protein ArsS [Solimonas sp.]